MVSIATVFMPHSRIEVLMQTKSLSKVVIVLRDDNIGTYTLPTSLPQNQSTFARLHLIRSEENHHVTLSAAPPSDLISSQ